MALFGTIWHCLRGTLSQNAKSINEFRLFKNRVGTPQKNGRKIVKSGSFWRPFCAAVAVGSLARRDHAPRSELVPLVPLVCLVPLVSIHRGNRDNSDRRYSGRIRPSPLFSGHRPHRRTRSPNHCAANGLGMCVEPTTGDGCRWDACPSRMSSRPLHVLSPPSLALSFAGPAVKGRKFVRASAGGRDRGRGRARRSVGRTGRSARSCRRSRHRCDRRRSRC
jgi:hypothetical protein